MLLHRLLSADAALRTWVATRHTAAMDAVMLSASWAGHRGLIWLVTGGVVMLVRRDRAADVWRMLLAVGLALLVNDAILKPAVHRAGLFTAVTYSFPSGHAASAVAGALAMTRAWPQAQPVWWTLVLLISLSRIYVGAHYPLDVAAGALVGAACAWFTLGGRPLRERHASPAQVSRNLRG